MKKQSKCAGCGKPFPDKLLFSWVDGNNIAITKHSKDYCWKCYNERYPNDKISIFTILQQMGHKVFVDSINMEVYIDDNYYKITPTLKEQLEKEYNL